VLTGGAGGGQAGQGAAGGVLTGARVVVERRCDRGKERRRLDLSVRAKEGMREFGREGKRGGEGRGVLFALLLGPRERWGDNIRHEWL
jgi:hypothetical protein